MRDGGDFLRPMALQHQHQREQVSAGVQSGSYVLRSRASTRSNSKDEYRDRLSKAEKYLVQNVGRVATASAERERNLEEGQSERDKDNASSTARTRRRPRQQQQPHTLLESKSPAHSEMVKLPSGSKDKKAQPHPRLSDYSPSGTKDNIHRRSPVTGAAGRVRGDEARQPQPVPATTSLAEDQNKNLVTSTASVDSIVAKNIGLSDGMLRNLSLSIGERAQAMAKRATERNESSGSGGSSGGRDRMLFQLFKFAIESSKNKRQKRNFMLGRTSSNGSLRKSGDIEHALGEQFDMVLSAAKARANTVSAMSMAEVDQNANLIMNENASGCRCGTNSNSNSSVGATGNHSSVFGERDGIVAEGASKYPNSSLRRGGSVGNYRTPTVTSSMKFKLTAEKRADVVKKILREPAPPGSRVNSSSANSPTRPFMFTSLDRRDAADDARRGASLPRHMRGGGRLEPVRSTAGRDQDGLLAARILRNSVAGADGRMQASLSERKAEEQRIKQYRANRLHEDCAQGAPVLESMNGAPSTKSMRSKRGDRSAPVKLLRKKRESSVLDLRQQHEQAAAIDNFQLYGTSTVQ